jgi:hypothetical protein
VLFGLVELVPFQLLGALFALFAKLGFDFALAVGESGRFCRRHFVLNPFEALDARRLLLLVLQIKHMYRTEDNL